jgi:hypothetical protein
MNNAANTEEEVSPVENDDPNARPIVAQSATPVEHDEAQLLSEGLFLPFGLEDSSFYRESSRIPHLADAARLPATSTAFDDGLIPVDENEVSPISPPVPLDEDEQLESNLQGLLGPEVLAAPAP